MVDDAQDADPEPHLDEQQGGQRMDEFGLVLKVTGDQLKVRDWVNDHEPPDRYYLGKRMQSAQQEVVLVEKCYRRFGVDFCARASRGDGFR